MKRFFSMYRVEQRMYFRTPDVILFCLAMPLVVFLGVYPKNCVNEQAGAKESEERRRAAHLIAALCAW